jgi:hypothetical protein
MNSYARMGVEHQRQADDRRSQEGHLPSRLRQE